MDVTGFSPHIFWSYDRSVGIPVEVVIKQVIVYGEVKDKLLLTKRIGKPKILDVINNWKGKEKAEKQICFMQKVILA